MITNVPIGISFVVTVGDGVTIDGLGGAVLAADPTYNVLIDAANVMGGSYSIGDGHPLANPNAAGCAAVNASTFSISAGRLAPKPYAAIDIELVALQLASTGDNCGSTSMVMLIQDDHLRGGNVGAGGKVLDTAYNIPVITFSLVPAC